MKKKTFIQIMVLTIVSLIMLSCQKENFDIDLQSQKWKLVKFKDNNDSSFKKIWDRLFSGNLPATRAL